jgi:hypothetical protein
VGGTAEDFEIEVEVHHGSALSSLLFITVIEETTKECRIGDPLELLYEDDLKLPAETKAEFGVMYGEGRQAMEKRVNDKHGQDKVSCHW